MANRNLKFSYNWNNKLECNAFTTLRMPDNWNVGDTVSIFLAKGKEWIYKGDGLILEKKTFYRDSINEYVARLDTGYSATKCKDLLTKMYKRPENFLVDLLLVTYTSKPKPE